MDATSLTYLLGDGTGKFDVSGGYGSFDAPTAVQLADLNGDKKNDVVTANAGSNSDIVDLAYFDDHRWSLAYHFRWPTLPRPSSLAIADFNGDGVLDVANSSSDTGTVAILTGDGNGIGGLNPPTLYGAGDTGVSFLAEADLNGDGLPDLAAVSPVGSSVSILLGDDQGGLTLAGRVGAGFLPQSTAIGDLNGDGHPDLAVVDSLGSVVVLNGNGDGSFTEGGAFTVGPTPASVAVSDLNADGRNDLVVANSGGQTVSVLMNTTGLPSRPTCVVPDVTGKALVQAKRAIVRRHCALGNITRVRAKARRGQVVAQRPASGRFLANGGRVDLAVSAGR
jgi:hypothetical protein